MTIDYLKKANPPVQQIDTATGETVRKMLAEIETGREDAVRRYARELDGWRGEIAMMFFTPATLAVPTLMIALAACA